MHIAFIDAKTRAAAEDVTAGSNLWGRSTFTQLQRRLAEARAAGNPTDLPGAVWMLESDQGAMDLHGDLQDEKIATFASVVPVGKTGITGKAVRVTTSWLLVTRIRLQEVGVKGC